ncbi:MAG: hypothetical protein L6Q76_10845, partial [Polyangiaceae bacterium]|nr:hypothetical protein [Polyangiaceae bacterium]
VLEFNPDPWVNVTVLATFNWSDKGLLLSCGEGAMGNEGFVAASDASSGQIRWVAFFNCSNPFIRVCAKDDNVVAENNHGHLWLFPRASPERVVISADPVEEPLLNKQPRD